MIQKENDGINKRTQNYARPLLVAYPVESCVHVCRSIHECNV